MDLRYGSECEQFREDVAAQQAHGLRLDARLLPA